MPLIQESHHEADLLVDAKYRDHFYGKSLHPQSHEDPAHWYFIACLPDKRHFFSVFDSFDINRNQAKFFQSHRLLNIFIH